MAAIRPPILTFPRKEGKALWLSPVPGQKETVLSPFRRGRVREGVNQLT